MRNKKGFTLIELLIVIAIIGILSAALLPTILNAPARGRDAARLGNMNSIVAALEAYNSDNGHYPNSTIVSSTGACIGLEDVFDTGLGSYFSGGNAPGDPGGTGRSIDDSLTDPEGCIAAGRYYYKYIGAVNSAEYIIGTVMEIEGNNNTTVAPSSVTDTVIPDVGSGADYYILVK